MSLKTFMWGVAAVLALSSCSKAEFSTTAAKNGGGITGAFDTTCVANNINNVTRMTKLMFIVDGSGSNAEYSYDRGTRVCEDPTEPICKPPTDFYKSFRGGALQQFFNAYKQKTNFYWGFSVFGAGTSVPYIASGSAPVFSNRPVDMQSAIDRFLSVEDSGGTPYKAALGSAAAAISSDPDRNSSANPQYIVIFLSDGFPSDYLNSSGVFQTDQLNTDLDSLLAIAPGRVSLSSLYYGSINDPAAYALLQNMAARGHGQFANVTNTSTPIRIDDLIPGSTVGCN